MDDSNQIINSETSTGVSSSSSQITDYYEKGRHCYSTRTAEAFEATDKNSNEHVLLWLLRYPLSADSGSIASFMDRLKRIHALNANTPRFKTYGVDSRGGAYLATDFVRGRSLVEQSNSSKAAERIFVEMLQAVDPFHQQGIVLSDISLDSFLIDEMGKVNLIAFMGSFEFAAKQTAMLPPVETLHFLAPEQRTGVEADRASDIFALGVYGYRLFTGRFPAGDRQPSAAEDVTALAAPPSQMRSDIPIWVDDVLGRCLEPKAEERFSDAGEVLEVVLKSIQSGLPPGGTSRWSRRTMVVAPGAKKNLPIRPRALASNKRTELSTVVHKQQEEEADSNAGVAPAVKIFTWAVALVVGVLGAGLLFLFFDEWSTPQDNTKVNIEQQTAFAPPELKHLIFNVTAQDVPIEKREEALGKIAENDDPIAYAVLVSLINGKSESRLKQAAQQFLIDRIKRQGKQRSAEVVAKWLDLTLKSKQNPADLPIYSLMLHTCDSSRPLDSRQKALEEAYKIDKAWSLQLAAALSLDEPGEAFVTLFRKFLAQETPGEDYSKRGVGALVISNRLTSYLFDEKSIGKLTELSDQDLMWSLSQSAKYDNPLIFDLSKEVLRRKSLPPFQSVFLTSLLNSGKFARLGDIQRALIRASNKDITKVELIAFGKWMSVDAEQVLLASCALIGDTELGVEAFDILVARSLQTEPVNSMVTWIKSRFWDYRKQMVKAVGILGLLQLASNEDINFAVEQLLPFAQGGTLFRMFASTNEPRLIEVAVVKLGEITPSVELLPLLSNKEKRVRMEVVKALRGRNELVVLQQILREFAKEKDEEVREVYKSLHWVTQENRGQAGQPPAAQVPKKE